MILATPQQLKFQQFLEQYPNERGRYELINGAIIEMQASRWQDDIADFLIRKFDREVGRSNLNYRVTGRLVLATQSTDGQQQGRRPDVSVVDLQTWQSNRFSPALLDVPIQLVVEVVSSNWEDDYIDKLDEYQRLGVLEYWIVDYLALGSRTYLGYPKRPTIFVYRLDENRVYQFMSFQGDEPIVSPTFTELKLTTNQILDI